MNRFQLLAGLGIVLAGLATSPCRAQGDAPGAPTQEEIIKLHRDSESYVRIVARALQWAANPAEACTRLRQQIGQLVAPAPHQSSMPLETPEALLQAYQRLEENLLARHALFSRSVYDAVRLGCLLTPEE